MPAKAPIGSTNQQLEFHFLYLQIQDERVFANAAWAAGSVKFIKRYIKQSPDRLLWLYFRM
ncbi:hypothetical protein GCM10009865_36250 [Aeromicrobium ponti]